MGRRSVNVLARLDETRCVHGAGLGSCPTGFCARARAAVLAAVADLWAPGPALLPLEVARSERPFCRWCHRPIRAALSERGWAHQHSNREHCPDGGSFAEPVTPEDQDEVRRRHEREWARRRRATVVAARDGHRRPLTPSPR